MNRSQSDGRGALEMAAEDGELRAFVAVRVGGYSWVVDLLPNYELKLGSSPSADIRVDISDVAPEHAVVSWNGRDIKVVNLDNKNPTQINGEPIEGSLVIVPGDEIKIGPALMVVSVTLAPRTSGRRSLTHQEFTERVTEELSRAARTGRPTCLFMLKSRSGDGSSVATAALNSFRGGDIVTAVSAFDPDAAGHPPDGRVVEEQRFDDVLEQIDQIVVSTDVRQFVYQDGLELIG